MRRPALGTQYGKGNVRGEERPLVVAVAPLIEPFASLAVLLGSRCLVRAVFDLAEAMDVVRAHPPRMILLTLEAARPEWMFFLEALELRHPACPLVVLWTREPPALPAILTRANVRAYHRMPVDVSTLLANLYEAVGVAAPRYSRHVLAAVDYLGSRLAVTITVGKVALAIGISESRLAHAFKSELGIPPKEYVTRRRIEAAKVLLRESRQTVTDVALATGFCDGGHLARVLAKHVGCAPGRLRVRPPVG